MGKSSPKIPVYAYKMSMTFGMCHGVLDWLHRLIVKEKTIWAGRKCGPDALYIDQPQVFGGHLEEGGVQGFAYLQPGTQGQFLHPVVATKHGGTPTTVPAFRGISTLSFCEAQVDPAVPGSELVAGGKNNPGFDGPGFYWVSGSPYLPGIWAEIQRIPRPFHVDKAYIFRESGQGEAPVTQNYCFCITWDEDIGLPGAQPSVDTWVRGIQDFDGDGVADSRADAIYTMIAKFCEKLTAIGEGASQITLHFFKGAVGISDTDILWSFNHPSFSDATNFAKVGPFAANTVDTVSGYPMDIPRGTNFGSHANNSSGFAGASGLLDAALDDHDAGANFSYIFLVSEHAEDDRWDRFSNGLPWKYGQGVPGNLEMKADYRRIAEEMRAKCIKFRMLAYYDFHINGTALDPDQPDTTGWDVLYMISGAEKRAYASLDEAQANAWYGPYIDVLHSSVAWHWYHARFHGFSSTEQNTNGSYNFEFTNIYSDPDTAEFYEFVINNPDYEFPFDVGGGAEAWIEYFFSGRIYADYHDANPSHMIVECLTNTEWGMGYPFSSLNIQTFIQAANTLYDETFGLSMMWTQQDAIEKFISEILDHINATLYINPSNGLFELKLLRDDYDLAKVPTLNPSNMEVRKFATRMAHEATNEITVSWTNPENEQEETVTLQDLGSIVAAGGRVKSETRNYYGVRRRDLATQILVRDIREASAPINSAEVKTNRIFWDLTPGDVVKFVYPELNIEEADPLVMRVTSIDYGKPGDSEILLTLVEDIFSLAPANFDVPPGTALVNTDTPPSLADQAQVMTLPYFFAFNQTAVLGADLASYPETWLGVLVEESDAGSVTFNLWGETLNPAGGTEQENFGNRDVLAQGTLQAALAWEAQSTVSDWGTLSNGRAPAVGTFVLIGDPADDETERELCLITDVTSGVYTLSRGVLDTVPRVWAAGTEFWFMSLNDGFIDITTRSAGEAVGYTVQIIATGGVLGLADIPAIPDYTATDRPWLPLRPSNVKINGLAFQDVFYTSVPANVPVTWNERNRLTENAQVLAWDDATVTAEVGTTYEIDIYDENDVLLNTITGITGTSYNIAEAEFSDTGVGYIRLFAKRDGLRSLQYYQARVDTRASTGYGFAYGSDYGGG